jgi:aspartate aminotransferase
MCARPPSTPSTPATRGTRRSPACARCGESDGFKLTPQARAAAITPRPRWLIPNSPSNPTGAVYSADELRALAEVLLDHPEVLLLSDDIYEHLIFDGTRFATMAQIEPRIRSRTVTITGPQRRMR